MQQIRKNLKNWLKGASRIAVLGVGSELRSDDAAGMMAARELEEFQVLKGPVQFQVFLGETAPENLTGQIKRFKPTHLIIIDSVEAGKGPGAVVMIDPQNTTGMNFSTHSLPPKVMADYLKDALQCDIVIVGIQPKDTRFGEKISAEVEAAVKAVVELIKNLAKIE